MKCAKEIVDIRSQANTVFEAEITAQTLAEYAVACKETISLCEGRINRMLEETASHHGNDTVCVSMPISMYQDRLGNKLFHLVVEEPNVYANGDSSWESAEETYSLDAMTEYLKQFCFEVSIQERGFKGRHWGCGEMFFPVLGITAIPECE